jgi:UDP-N-acetylmuramyl pentapeptide phosphotransferase/UDP-N-acetylglucosamine-1-phosphate transferase
MVGNYPLPLPGNQLGLNSIWGIVILYVFMMGLINAYNFMDGINGITGLYSLLFILTCVVISYYQGTLHTSSMLTFGTILSFLVVFGVFNYRSKALAFLGDSGSVFLGLFIGVYLLILNVTTASVNVVVLLAVYGVDSVLTIGLRLLRRENIFKAHRSHLYQDLVHVKKWGHIQVAMAYAGVQLLINFIVFVPIINKSLSTTLVLSILALLSTIYLWAKYRMNQLYIKRIPNE